MSSQKLLFAEMLATRFCHDIAGPISAVNNGLEFLGGETKADMQQQAMDLLKLSAEESFAKLQIYRIAYGRANHATEADVDEVKDIVARFFAHTKVQLDWPESPADGFPARINSEIRQLLVNMITLVASQLVYGGKLSIRKGLSGGHREIEVKGSHDRLRQNEEIAAILAGEGDGAYTPQNVPFYLLYELSKSNKVELTYNVGTDEVLIVAKYA